MGIVAHCPAGHRIKVKDHLAGKKGICPTCGGRFRIPLRGSFAGDGLRAGDAPVATIVSFDRDLAATLPQALPLAGPVGSPAESRMAAAGPSVVSPVEDDLTVQTDRESAADMPAAIAEAMSASWSVAVPGGQPSEIMTGEALLEWLASGLVTGGELVWRSDWAEWRSITAVFPDRLPANRRDGPPAW